MKTPVRPDYLVEVLRPENFSRQTALDIQRLYRSLSPNKPDVDIDGMGRALPNISVWIARQRETDKVVAMATLIISPASLRQRQFGTIEDVVTLFEHRGHGIMRKILGCIINQATSERLPYLQLTSRPDADRDAARKLYESIGFICIAEANPNAKRRTNVYRLFFE